MEVGVEPIWLEWRLAGSGQEEEVSASDVPEAELRGLGAHQVNDVKARSTAFTRPDRD